ncbi:MAG: V-type ATP synthase subunit B [Gammaproteobacteria bacterium]|nr:V-type ATP synthase subunit B [Gammaproteobacteria bacterium]
MNSNLKQMEYRQASAARSGLLFMKNIPGIAYGDQVIITDHANNQRHGQVVQTSDDVIMVQVIEGTEDMDLERTWVRFLDQPFEVALSTDVLGRIFNGMGQPKDDRPPIVSMIKQNVNGHAVNPAARAYPKEFIQTGITAIDGLNSLVRGQKLPIFSGSGLPHNRILAQIVRQAKLLDEESNFAIVFAAMGVSYSDALFFRNNFEQDGVLSNVVMFINQADDPTLERLLLPRTALTTAEYLAFEENRHVLVLLSDMTNYAEALREVSTAKGDVPARKGYPGYLYSDLAGIYERAGRIKNRHGSITMIPVVTMPSDDITHPIPDLTGYITEGQIVLSRELYAQNIYPPINISPSLSRLMKDGVGKNDTRDDHLRLANQLYASYAKALEVRNLASIIGADDLPEADQDYLKFAQEFEQQYINQEENQPRSIFESLNIAWALLSLLPASALSRVSETDIAKYYHQQKTDAVKED